MSLLYTSEKKYLPLIDKYAGIISAVAPNVNVEALVLAHMKQESGFSPNAYRDEPKINDASRGLLQLLFSTANRYEKVTAEALYDPETNIRIAMKYIAKNLDDWSGNIEDAIASYNAGTVYQNEAGQYTNSKGDLNVQQYVDAVHGNYIDYLAWIDENKPTVNAMATDTGIIVLVGAIAAFLGWKYVR